LHAHNYELEKKAFLINLEKTYTHQLLQEIGQKEGKKPEDVSKALDVVISEGLSRKILESVSKEDDVVFEVCLAYDEVSRDPAKIEALREKIRHLSRSSLEGLEPHEIVQRINPSIFEHYDGKGEWPVNHYFMVLRKKSEQAKLSAPAERPTPWTPPSTLTPDKLEDARQYQATLYKNGDLTQTSHWHERAMERTLALLLPHIKNGGLGADFSTGTGGSVIELFKQPIFHDGLKARLGSLLAGQGLKKKSIHMDLFDAMDSWFSEAYRALHERVDVSFFKIYKKTKTESRFLTLDEFHGPGAYDFVMSVSTLHLIDPEVIYYAIQGVADGLKEGGYFAWASGDIPPGNGERVNGAVFLHDPFRFMREAALAHIANDPQFDKEREFIQKEGAQKLAAYANKIFLPHPPTLDVVNNALKQAGLVGKTYTEKISFTDEEAVQFIMVPRLLDYLPEVPDITKRKALVEKVMREEVLPKLPRDPKNPKAYLTYWTFGLFKKQTPSHQATPHAIQQAA
jgi:hypothetical protein